MSNKAENFPFFFSNFLILFSSVAVAAILRDLVRLATNISSRLWTSSDSQSAI